MSIVRVGLSESQQYASGYDAIFGGKKKPAPVAKAVAKAVKGEKRPVKKK